MDMYACTHTLTHTHSLTHACTRTHTHTHNHVHTHTHKYLVIKTEVQIIADDLFVCKDDLSPGLRKVCALA